MTRLRNERGFAIPLTIFVVAIVTVMLAALHLRTQMDRRLAESSAVQMDALMVAQSGLEMYFATWSDSTRRPANGDSIRLTVSGPDGTPIGFSWVVPYVLRKPLDTLANWTYVVKSTGHVVQPSMGADPQAVRTIAQFAQWQTGAMHVLAALTAANGLTESRGRGNVEIDGREQCAPPGPGFPGLRTSGSDPGIGGIFGTPTAVVAGGRDREVVEQTQVNWAATVSGGLVPDYTTFPSGDFTYPIQIINGDEGFPSWAIGNGILVVRDDLIIDSRGFIFHGVVLVGGTIVFGQRRGPKPNVSIYGAVMTGLNGTGVARMDVGGGTDLYIRYCADRVESALATLTGLMPISNAWVDDWASY